MKPITPRRIRNENSQPCKTYRRWTGHFERVLNVVSDFDLAVVDDVRQCPIHIDEYNTK